MINTTAANGATRHGIWPLIHRLLPWLAAAIVAFTGLAMIVLTPAGHIPDVWAHTYRVSGILNGDVLARPVASKSILHAGDGTVGGCVDRSWLQFSIDHYDGYDPNAVPADFLEHYGAGTAASDSASEARSSADCVDTPYNNAAVNSPVAYLPQLAAFALGRAMHLGAAHTYVLAEVFMLIVYVAATFASVSILPRWRLPMALLLACPLLTFRYSYAISADSMAQAMCLLYTCLLFACMTSARSDAFNARSVPDAQRSPGLWLTVTMMMVGVLMAMSKFTFTPLLLLALLTLIPARPQCRGLHMRMPQDSADGTLTVPAAKHAATDLPVRSFIVALGTVFGFVFLGIWMRLTSWFTTTPGVVSYEAMSDKKHLLFADPFGKHGVIGALQAIGRAILTGQSNLHSRSQTMIILALWAAIVAVCILLLVATLRRTFDARMGWFAWCMIAVATGIILLTYLALWLQYTPAGTLGVDGVQFRYFLPLGGCYVLCACESAARVAHSCTAAARNA
ncbi:hypothetical protein D2E25_1141 [Bifidobacterium goeldii]|uniref:DUF2142 domain-containing protein n=1 Tax=Bifidobacterium goeldii TaxID=2306975 RepID=A0A430FKD5_9BIFI|nr:DUF2142 domain-containing protein [Bifidobacterium goeldii]RSX53168.1 hypothetical protein D2E25_1141 [Bifidobacterium goeldii]